jgi:diacylglycerol kinase family enzyme
MPVILSNLVRLFDGSIQRVPRLITRTFADLTIERGRADPIQIDGELVEIERDLHVTVKPRCLRTLVPAPMG